MNLKRTAVAVAAGVSLIAVGFWYGGARAATAEPGSIDDPLVTKSYVEELVAGLANKAYVDQTVAGLANKAYVDQAVATRADKAYVDQAVANLVTKDDLKAATSFQIVTLSPGQRFLGDTGTEIVLRGGGKATVIAGAKGGVLDATDGVDLAQGQSVKANHLLVIPVGDGRGLSATIDVILMVKGSYTVKAVGQ